MLKKVFYERFLCSKIKLEFDFDVYTTWKIQFHQSVNCFLSWVDDVDQAFVCTHFELLTRVFVLVRRTDDGVEATLSWKWYWTSNCRACTASSVNDFFCRCVKCTVLVRFQTDTDFFVCHLFSFSVMFYRISSSRKPTRVAWQCNRACRNLLTQRPGCILQHFHYNTREVARNQGIKLIFLNFFKMIAPPFLVTITFTDILKYFETSNEVNHFIVFKNTSKSYTCH